MKSHEIRYSLASIICNTGSFAVVLSYIRRFEPQELFTGFLIVCGAAVGGCLLGSYFYRTSETAFWSALGAATAFMCAVGEPLTHELFVYAWPLVGACAAASAILLDRYHLLPRMAVGSVIGIVLLWACSYLPSQLGSSYAWIEVLCGSVAGAIMVGVVWIFETSRSWLSYSRSFLSFALVMSVVGGNVAGRWIGWL